MSTESADEAALADQKLGELDERLYGLMVVLTARACARSALTDLRSSAARRSRRSTADIRLYLGQAI